jgi:hypothetical protein
MTVGAVRCCTATPAYHALRVYHKPAEASNFEPLSFDEGKAGSFASPKSAFEPSTLSLSMSASAPMPSTPPKSFRW